MAESLQEARADAPALLLLLNASADIDALVRSGEREVLRWSRAGADAEHFAGDPSDPRTYECARAARAVTAVIDMPTDEEAEAALAALRAVRPDAAVLVLSDASDDVPGDGTLIRGGSLRDVLRLDLEEELERLEAERRAFCLRSFAADSPVVPILIHPDPDPDAIACAFGLRVLLQRSADESPIVTLGAVRRPENHRMVELLHLRIAVITRAELCAFEKVITVDMQPSQLTGGQGPRFAVIDHHPAEAGYDAEFLDVRAGYGACASMVTEYLRATEERRIQPALSSALLHGIRTDTDLLSRGVSADDVRAYAFLQERCDRQLLRRMEKPTFPAELARAYGLALANLREENGIVLAHAGELEDSASHLLPEIADFCLGIETTTLVAASAFIGDELTLALRYAGAGDCDAGEVARAIAAQGGKGGGHAAMARVTLPRELAEERFGKDDGELPGRLLRYLGELAGEVQDEVLSRRS